MNLNFYIPENILKFYQSVITKQGTFRPAKNFDFKIYGVTIILGFVNHNRYNG